MNKIITLRDMTEDEFENWKEWSINDYAKCLIVARKIGEAEALEQAEFDFSACLPDGIKTSNHYIFVVENEEKNAVGMISCAKENKSDAFIEDFVITTEHRRKGYAAAVLIKLEDILKKEGKTNIVMHIFSENIGAIKLYESLGYARIESQATGSCYMKKNI